MPFVQRQAPLGLEVLAHLRAGERGEGHRLRVGARLRDPHRGDGLAPRLRQDGAAEQAADTALVRGHAVGGIALHVLDVLVAFAVREPHVLGGDVVLQVDEGLARAAHLEERSAAGAGRIRRCGGGGHGREAAAEFGCDRARRPLAVSGCRGEPEDAVRGPRERADRARQLGGEGDQILAPAAARARLRRECREG